MVGLLTLACAATAFAQSAAVPDSSSGATGGGYGADLSLSMIFTAFLVMLGPLKLIGPFVKLTSHMDEAEARKVALKAIGIACLGGLMAAFVGQRLLKSWNISFPALHLAAGVVLLLVALKSVLAQYEPAEEASGAAPGPRNLAFSPLAFPRILTPYGIAIFILILAVTPDTSRDLAILGLFLFVMGLNVAVMWFARPFVHAGGALLAVLGAVLGVLQVALAIQMLITALRSMHVLPA